MKLKKERNHNYGSSNIDFRTKRDEESIRLYQPWMMGKEVGTMGFQDYHLSFDEKKATKFLSTQKITTLKDVNNEFPNPKYHQTAEFYFRNGIKLHNPKTLTETERPGNLNETIKGKELFTGDSMMISLNTKLKNKEKSLSKKDKLKKHNQIENLSKIKNQFNKEAYQETQLVKIEAQNTLEGKVDLKKIKEIRLALRRRYANRTHIRKLFKNWDVSGNGFISLYDAHSMINKLAIPINFNETRALIASTSNEGVLKLDDFVSLIYNDNQTLNVNLDKIECKFSY